MDSRKKAGNEPNKYALITGASSGIGLELARIFASHGHPLVLVARRRQRLLDLADELAGAFNSRVHCIACDLTAQGALGEMLGELDRAGIQIEYLVNNAGIGQAGEFSGQALEEILKMLDLNVRVPVELCKYFLPKMLSRSSGGILNVASTAAFQPGPNMAIYYATKAFLLSFSEALSREVQGTGVHITALCPGPTESEFHERAGMLSSRAIRGRKLPSSKDVARFGYQSLLKNRPVAVHGVLNRALIFMVRLAPRRLIREAVHWIQKG